MDDRLNELELRYTEQQSLLQELSDVLYRQQREIDALTGEVARLKAKISSFGEPANIGPAEKPPHY